MIPDAAAPATTLDENGQLNQPVRDSPSIPDRAASADFFRLLDEQRDRFEFATAASDIGYWFCNLPFDKLIWDSRVKKHFWLSPDTEVDIDLFYAQLHPDDRERTRVAIEHSIASHTRYDIEYRTVSAEGELRWLRATGRTAYDISGTPIRFDGVTQDITGLKLTQQALDAERQRLAAVFDNVPVGLVFSDREGRIESGNRRAEQIVGHSILYSENIEQYIEWVAFHPDGRRVEAHEFPLARALTDGGTHKLECLYRCGDGNLKWVEFVGAPMLDSQGMVTGGVVATTDLDARKRAEEALIRNEKLAAVGRLASSIAHEINNPLESVTNLLYLARTTQPSPELDQYLEDAERELRRVSAITNQTLRFYKQTTGPTSVGCSELFRETLSLYQGRLLNSNILVEKRKRANRPTVCFEGEIRQVLSNLIANAIDAMPRGGRLLLRSREATDWKTSVKGLALTVADTGTGMPAKVLDKVFEAFFSTKGIGGTGLGLWVSKELIDKHHGRLRVRSSTDSAAHGTVFTLFLPFESKIAK